MASFSPQRVSSTASSMDSRPESQPMTERRGEPPGLGASSTWISTSTGREPSSPANTALPETLPRRSARNSAEGLATSASPRAGHLEHADLVGGAEAVLHPAQDAELVAAIAFEMQHHVHHVLQHARPGDVALLGHMPDQHQRETLRLRGADQLEGRRAHLRDRAGGGVHAVGPHGLDGVDNHQRRVGELRQAGQDIAQAAWRRRDAWATASAPAAARACGSGRRILRPRYTPPRARPGPARRRPAAAGWICRCPGSPPTSTTEAGTSPPPSTRSNSAIVGGHARRRRGDALQPDELDPAALAGAVLHAAGQRLGRDLLFQRVPLAAGLAPPRPFREDATAGRADVGFNDLSQNQLGCQP